MGRLLYTLGDGQWDIPALRTLLEKICRSSSVLDGYEVEHEFPKIGHRTMLLNARTVVSESNAQTALLLAIEDISERRAQSGSWRICCVKRNCCWRKCSTASPTACRSSPVFSC